MSFSSSGGAGVIAKNLVAGLKNRGVDAEIFSLTDGGLLSIGLKKPSLFLAGLVDFFLVRKDVNNPLFSLFRSDKSSLSNILNSFPFPKKTILHLHWVPGVLNINDIINLDKKGFDLVVTLHDMFFFTGGCHQSLNCLEFRNGCITCPQVRVPFRRKVKRAASDRRDLSSIKLTVISPNRWIQDYAKISPSLEGAQHILLGNPISETLFGFAQLNRVIRQDISSRAIRMGFCAKDLDDPLKRLDSVIKVLKKINEKSEHKKIILALAGNSSRTTEFAAENWIEFKGNLNDDRNLADFYGSCDFLINFSKGETLPTTLLEALAFGCPIICSEVGGMPLLVQDSQAGYIAKTERDLELVVKRLLEISEEDLNQIRKRAYYYISKNLNPSKILEAHLTLYRGFEGIHK